VDAGVLVGLFVGEFVQVEQVVFLGGEVAGDVWGQAEFEELSGVGGTS
jgi:hypothetical protein